MKRNSTPGEVRVAVPVAKVAAVADSGAKQGKIPIGDLFRWSWNIVSVAWGWFTVSIILSISVGLLSKYSVQVVAIVVNGLAGAALGSKGPPEPQAGTQDIVGQFLTRLLPGDAETAVVVFAVVAILVVVFRFLEDMASSWTDNIMLGRLQHKMHDKLLTLGPTYHEKHNIGETTLIMTSFAGSTQLLLRELISFPLTRGISLITALIFLWYNLTAIGDTPGIVRAIMIAALVLLPILGWRLSTRVAAAFWRVRETNTALVNEFTDSASMPLEVQVMGAEKQRSEAFGSRVLAHVRNRISATLQTLIARHTETAIPTLLQVMFLLYGVFYALKSGSPAAAGAIVAIYSFVPETIAPLQEVNGFVTGLYTGWPQVEKVVEILNAESDVKEDPEAVDLSPADRSVRFENVTFSYVAGGKRTLDKVSYTFEAGRITAIVARLGTGKSSLLNLVTRIREPQQGNIWIGNKDLRNIKLSSLRSNVVKVSQFPLYVVGTVRTNMHLANPIAADDEIESVCRKTGLWEELLEVAKRAGLDGSPLDYVVPRLEGLSGGQRRLLALTRALLLNPSVLLLDEPTTGVDSRRSSLLMEVIRDAFKGITVLLVDQNMEFVYQVADQVCCLEDGRFTDVGPPSELADRDNPFRELLNAFKAKPG